ncbi:MAG: hypothetical protein R3F30_04540 [Planctomycetota bacterium]
MAAFSGECRLGGTHGIPASHENVLGGPVADLLVLGPRPLRQGGLGVILRADNRGRVILALMSLIRTRLPRAAAPRPALIVIGLFGAALQMATA